MKPRIIIDSDIPFIKGRLEDVADTIYIKGSEISRQLLAGADAMIIRTRTKCNRDLLHDTPVKVISTATIGRDHIETGWCEENGIIVRSAPGCNARGVAQYLFSSIFHEGFEPGKDTLGIIGYGNVGSIVAGWAHDMGIDILVNDPPKEETGDREIDYKSLEYVLRNSDAITLHVPFTKTGVYATKGLIGAKELAMMKDNSIIVNSSRGGVVNEEALKEELRKGRLRAIIDVWEKEPEIDRELLDMVSIGTPHIAGYSHEGKVRATRMALEAMEDYFGFKANTEGLYPIPKNPDEKMTRRMIEESYNPKVDHDNLRCSPESFENLRNNYNYRHEPGF